MFCIVLIINIVTISCINNPESSKKSYQNENGTQASGKYHFLEDNGTKIYLPNGFERTSLSRYQRLLDSLYTTKEYKFETDRLNSLSKMDGSLYIFFNKIDQSTFTINTVPYIEFNKDSANQLLELIRSNNEKVAKNSDANFEKVTAKFGGKARQQLFKAIYKVSGKNLKNDIFNTTYIISANDKTVYTQLTSSSNTDFDPFIKKMKL